MNRFFIVLLIAIVLTSCGAKKRTITRKKPQPAKKEQVVKVEPTEKPEKELLPPTIKKPVINSTEDYINLYKDIAVDEMRTYHIPASITLAQGILESGSGKGRLAIEANNHFGIKCHNWSGAKIYHDDDALQECFRKYNDAKFSYRDHSKFLSERKRYANLFKLNEGDYKGWARELRKAGYATDKRYPQKLIALIERYNLTQYDAIVLGKRPKKKKQRLTILEHTVVKGDTLYSLSRQYNISVKTLQRLNNLSGTDIKIGQVLKVED